MGKKYFTLSFDDGLEQDKRVIRLMRQYGLKGTFNLNAGLFGTRGEVKGLGTFSFQDCPEGVKHKFPFSYVQHNRIPQDEVRQVYEGMEIATHGFRHEPLGAVSEDEMRASVDADKAALEKIFGTTVVGHAYAQGSTSPAAQAYLKAQGYQYARVVFPDEPHLHFGLQLIFDESQKEGNNEIWIDCYQLVQFLQLNRSETKKNPETKEYFRVLEMRDPAVP